MVAAQHARWLSLCLYTNREICTLLRRARLGPLLNQSVPRRALRTGVTGTPRLCPAGSSDVSPQRQRRRRGLPNQPDLSEQAGVRAEVRPVHGSALYPRDEGHPSVRRECGAVLDRSPSSRVSSTVDASATLPNTAVSPLNLPSPLLLSSPLLLFPLGLFSSFGRTTTRTTACVEYETLRATTGGSAHGLGLSGGGESIPRHCFSAVHCHCCAVCTAQR